MCRWFFPTMAWNCKPFTSPFSGVSDPMQQETKHSSPHLNMDDTISISVILDEDDQQQLQHECSEQSNDSISEHHWGVYFVKVAKFSKNIIDDDDQRGVGSGIFYINNRYNNNNFFTIQNWVKFSQITDRTAKREVIVLRLALIAAVFCCPISEQQHKKKQQQPILQQLFVQRRRRRQSRMRARALNKHKNAVVRRAPGRDRTRRRL